MVVARLKRVADKRWSWVGKAEKLIVLSMKTFVMVPHTDAAGRKVNARTDN